MSRKLLMSVLAAGLLIAACGGGDGGGSAAASTTTTVAESEPPATTTVAPTTTTTEATTTTADSGGRSVDLSDIPQECIDAFGEFLRAIEPTLEVVDWETASLDELEDISDSMDEEFNEYEAATAQSGCDDLEPETPDNDQTFDYLLAIAEAEAPGTVPYFEMLRDLVEGTGDSTIGVSGDCETDIAAFEAVVEEYGTMQQMPVANMTVVADLASSISTNCTVERVNELYSQEDVANFMGG